MRYTIGLTRWGAVSYTHLGQKLSQEWGYIAERFFIDDEEANNAPRQFGTYGAGDIKYKDINNDGVINTDDMVPIGFPTVPEIIWGSGVTVGIHNFDFSCFFQGSAPVSYTHLDVYKRQGVNSPRRAIPAWCKLLTPSPTWGSTTRRSGPETPWWIYPTPLPKSTTRRREPTRLCTHRSTGMITW